MFANIFFSDVRDRYQRLSLRERLLVLLVLGVVFYFFFDGVVFDSQHRRRHELESSEAQLQKQIAEVSLELSSVARPRSDELERREQEYRSLKQKVEQLDAVLAGVSAETPKIAKLVGGVLAAVPVRVKAVGVKTVPVKALLGNAQPSAAPASGKTEMAAAQQPIYKHGVDIELRGSYLDLLNYLNKLEDAHTKLFWSDAAFSAGTYPENTLRASVFMLSTKSNL
jgi:MSHA biogenesis protein MshJ